MVRPKSPPNAARRKLHCARVLIALTAAAFVTAVLGAAPARAEHAASLTLPREGRKLGIPTPFHAMAYACLKPYAHGTPAKA